MFKTIFNAIRTPDVRKKLLYVLILIVVFRLGCFMIMASDGVSEVMDENGVELGTTKLYQNTICTSAEKSPKDFIDDVVNLVHTYNGGRKLRDDLTMMVAKVVN